MFLAACMCLAYGCKDDDNKAWNNDAPVYIWGKDRDGNKAVDQKVEKVHDLLIWGMQEGAELCMRRDMHSGFTKYFEPEDIDTINNRVKFKAGEIIWDGHINDNWLKDRDWFIQKEGRLGRQLGFDTVAYIPNSQLDFAEDTINKLFAKGDFDQIYKIFETAFQFIPCTGADFKKMKANGTN